MSVTFLNGGAGGTWIVDAPAGVTVTQTQDPAGLASSLHISVDYNDAASTDPTTGSILGVNFIGPSTGAGVTTVDYVYAGVSQNAGDLPVLRFLAGSKTTVHSLGVGASPTAATTYASVVQESNSSSTAVTGDVTINNGVVTVGQQAGGHLALDEVSQITNGGTVIVTSSGARGPTTVSGTVNVDPIGQNTLILGGERVSGNGAIIQRGENDITHVGKVGGVQLQIGDGALTIANPSPFDGTTGAAPGNPNSQAIGSIEVLGPALNTARATFDTSSGVLSLFDGGGQYLGGLRFSGDASGLALNVTAGLPTNDLAITDHPGGAGGTIPITFS